MARRAHKHTHPLSHARHDRPRPSGCRIGIPQSIKRKRKKIDPNVGEYVEFVEISTVRDELNTDNSGNTSKFRTEQQIVDAEWVDIPDKK